MKCTEIKIVTREYRLQCSKIFRAMGVLELQLLVMDLLHAKSNEWIRAIDQQ